MTTRSRRPRLLLGLVPVAVLAAACATSGGPASPTPSSPASTASMPSPSVAASPNSSEATAPIGTWTTTISEADLRAAGMTDPGLLAENSGTFTMTLTPDGTWTTAQEASVPLRWPVFRGTYTVTGPGAFTQRTEFPADYAGDIVGFEWTMDGGAVRFSLPRPPDAVLPIIMETHPWQPRG